MEGPNTIIGHGKRRGMYPDTRVPGPGRYKPRPQSASVRLRSPTHIFGKSLRDRRKDFKIPGPGHYKKKGFTSINKMK